MFFNNKQERKMKKNNSQLSTVNSQLNMGKTLWKIADQLRGAMNADDFRDYMLSFLFLRYLSDNYEKSAKKELGRDYPQLDENDKNQEILKSRKS